MSFQHDEMYSFAEWAFDINQPPTQTVITRKIHKNFEHPPRWDSFRNRIMTDEQAAPKVRDDAAAAAAKQRRKSRWNSKYYSKDLSHISGLAGPVLELINPGPADAILDVGCGDGALTVALANKVPQGTIVGLDDSAALVEYASTTHAVSFDNLVFIEHDPAKLDEKPDDLLKWEGAWDWVFSNSTFHRTLRHQEARTTLFENVHRLLKPGGRLVFECGGAGNVPEAITALTAAMAMHGIPSERRRDVHPWFCPSVEWAREALEGAGFDVLECKLHHEPSKVSIHDGSLEGWIRQLGAPFIDAVEPDPGPQRDCIVKWVCEVLNDSVERKEDGTRWLSYVRLRVLAKKKRADHTPNVIRRMFDQGALIPGRMSGKGTSFSFI
ncbi:putative Methyltransferase domain-containing protein [Septoria linicola]|nr:putative Methyltransferase domain-containing protein [Septoria linicola]